MKTDTQQRISKAKACLLLGAYGDSLGAPVEFMSLDEVLQKYPGNDTKIKGIQKLDVAYGVEGAITDDTQMTLVLADSLIGAFKRGQERGILAEYVFYTLDGYLLWLQAQGESNPSRPKPLILGKSELYEVINKQGKRAPGTTCLNSLKSINYELATSGVVNNSMGCGSVMRMAPIGLFFGNWWSSDEIEEAVIRSRTEAATDSNLTHGHIVAEYMSSALASIIAQVLLGVTLEEALATEVPDDEYDRGLVEEYSKSHPETNFNHPGVFTLIKNALQLADEEPSTENLQKLGRGWVADEALAMAIYCALQYTKGRLDVKDALRLAVNHDGDSDSVGSITGNLIGVIGGMECVPSDIKDLDTEFGQLYDLIENYGEELITVRSYSRPELFTPHKSYPDPDLETPKLVGTDMIHFLFEMYDYADQLCERIENNESPEDSNKYLYFLLLIEKYFDLLGRVEISQAAHYNGESDGGALSSAHKRLDMLRKRINNLIDGPRWKQFDGLMNDSIRLLNNSEE